MIANRIISFFFLVATLGLFVYASPVARSDDAKVLSIVTDLKTWVDAKVLLFDGVTDPTAWAGEIADKISASVDLIVKVDISVADTASTITEIVAIVLSIISALGKAAAKYGVVIASALTVKFGLSITLLVTAIIKIIPATSGSLGSWA